MGGSQFKFCLVHRARPEQMRETLSRSTNVNGEPSVKHSGRTLARGLDPSHCKQKQGFQGSGGGGEAAQLLSAFLSSLVELGQNSSFL